MSVHARVCAGRVALILVIAIGIGVITSAFVAKRSIESFENAIVSSGAATASLGAAAGTLMRESDRSVTGIAMVDSTLGYAEFRTRARLAIESVSASEIRLSDAGDLLARGAFIGKHFVLKPDDVPSESTNGSTRSYRVRAGRGRTMSVKHTANHPFDFTPYIGGLTPSIEFLGARAVIDTDAYPVKVNELRAFATPEILKRRPLAGVTIVAPLTATQAVVRFRRYEQNEYGVVLFCVETRDDGASVLVKYAETDARAIERESDASARLMAWDGVAPLALASRAEGSDVSPRATSAVAVLVPTEHRHSHVIVEVTPGMLRVTGAPISQTPESYAVRVDPLMSAPAERWASHPSHPLQMAVQNAAAFPFPIGDHVRLSEVLRPHLSVA